MRLSEFIIAVLRFSFNLSYNEDMEVTKRFAGIRHIITALSVNALFMSAVLCFCYVNYETNDDQLMVHLLHGSLSGEPSPYLIYLNILFSKLLYYLVLWKPGMPWYPLAQYAAVFLSFTVIFSVLMKNAYICSAKRL